MPDIISFPNHDPSDYCPKCRFLWSWHDGNRLRGVCDKKRPLPVPTMENPFV